MNTSTVCPFESNVLHACASGDWSESLRNHLRQCDDCMAAAAVAPFIETLAAQDARERPLPDPAIVWMKAQLLRGTSGLERAARPLQFAQFAAYAIVAAGWAALLSWKSTAIQGWLHDFTATRLLESAATGPSLSLTFFAGVLLLSSATVVLGLHTILAEE